MRHSLFHASESIKQELIEFLVLEIIVLDFSRRALVIHIVGWISYDQISQLAVHEEFVGFGFCTVAANQTMITKKPEVTCFRYARFFQFCVHIEIIFFCIFIGIEKAREFLFIKPSQRKFEIICLQRFNLDFQHLLVPACIESHAVIREYVRFLLRRGEVIHKHARHSGDIFRFCC